MSDHYYFLATALPPLRIGYPPDITFSALLFLLKTNLTKRDYEKIKVIRRYYDIQNIRSFWLKEDLDPRGNFDVNELEENLLTGAGFPEYVFDFLRAYEKVEERLRYFSALIVAYFRYESESQTDFLKEFLTFEREWRLVFTGFRAKRLDRELTSELQFEDPNDEIVRQILAQKDAKTYEPPSRYSELKAIFDELKDAPLQLYQALCVYRFHKIEKMYGINEFSIQRVLSYFAKFIIAQKWLELNKKKGMQVVDSILGEEE